MDPELRRNLSRLNAAELTEALKKHFESSGGLAPAERQGG
jgi:hypothetical protein